MREEQFRKWEITRNKGIGRYLFINGVIYFGLTMFIIMAFVQKPFVDGMTSVAAITHYITWPMTGLFYGITTWFFAEWQYKNGKAQKNSAVKANESPKKSSKKLSKKIPKKTAK